MWYRIRTGGSRSSATQAMCLSVKILLEAGGEGSSELNRVCSSMLWNRLVFRRRPFLSGCEQAATRQSSTGFSGLPGSPIHCAATVFYLTWPCRWSPGVGLWRWNTGRSGYARPLRDAVDLCSRKRRAGQALKERRGLDCQLRQGRGFPPPGDHEQEEQSCGNASSSGKSPRYGWMKRPRSVR